MKVFLAYPPPSPAMRVDLSQGCLALEAYLRSKGREVSVYQGEIFNITLFMDQMMKAQPDVLGLTCDCFNMHLCFSLVKAAKEFDKTIVAVLGGPQATLLDNMIIERIPYVDAVVRGEGEEILAEIVDCCAIKKVGVDLSKVKGLSFRKDGKVVKTADREYIYDLDRLPIPQKDMAPRYSVAYRAEGPIGSIYQTDLSVRRLFFMETGRGCPFNCNFCNEVGFWQRKPRQKSMTRIIEEIRFLMEFGGAKKIFFRENTFTANRARVVEFCESLIKNKVNIEWECGTRVDCVDKDLLKLMFDTGCRCINYGVESFSDKVLRAMNKGTTKELAVKIIRETHNVGIMPDYNILLGHPGETEATLEETYNQIRDLGIYADPLGVKVFRLVGGSTIYIRMKEKGLVQDEMWFDSDLQLHDFGKHFYSPSFQQTISQYKRKVIKLYGFDSE